MVQNFNGLHKDLFAIWPYFKENLSKLKGCGKVLVLVKLLLYLVQGFRVICFITGQYNTKGYGTITDVI